MLFFNYWFELSGHYLWAIAFYSKIVNAPSERKIRDDKTVYTEYRCEDAHEIVYREILKQSYCMFRLFNGTFHDNFIGEDEPQQIDHFINKLNKFYSKVWTNCDFYM